MSVTRRLASILAIEIDAYSQLMAADEEFTHERLKEYLHELVGPRINQHRGRLVKNTGDRMLAEFSSVVDPVRSAAEIQYGIADRRSRASEPKELVRPPLRRFRNGSHRGVARVQFADTQ